MPPSVIFLLAGTSAVLAQGPADQDVLLLRGGTVHTISGPVIENGSILIRNGRIIGVGRNLTAPDRAKVIDLEGQQVYPGMIDSASMANPASEHSVAARANGITSAMLMRADDVMGGPVSVTHLNGAGADAMRVAITLRFPAIVTKPVRPHESVEDDEEPATATEEKRIPYSAAKKDYEAKMRALNQFFEAARRYRTSKLARGPGFAPDSRYEPMMPVLEGAEPLLVTAVREREIREAIAFAERQKIRIILADPYEAYKVLPLIKARDIPVVLGPTYTLPPDQDDDYDRSYTTPAQLYVAGIRFCIATFSSLSSRNLPYQAAAAVPFGLPHDQAYKAVSLNAAEIFGLGKRMGSIDEGKVADLIVTDGDPLETTTHINQVFIDGKPASLETRQRQLYEKYLARP
jgi:imidazolonepropionase-like amidohydrolase